VLSLVLAGTLMITPGYSGSDRAASYLQSGARHTGMVTGLWLGRAW